MASTDRTDLPPGAARENELCCCPPKARVIISNRTTAIQLENSIQIDKHKDVTRHFKVSSGANVNEKEEVRGLAAAAVKPPQGPDSAADSEGAARVTADSDSNSDSLLDSEVKKDHVVRKDQAKIYRMDTWIIEWEAEGDGDLRVSLSLGGLFTGVDDWLPRKGKKELAKNYVLHPPYQMPGPDFLEATLTVTNCERVSVSNRSRAQVG